MYQGENAQEDFLVFAGERLLRRAEAQRRRGEETSSGDEADAPFPAPTEGRYREGTLPSLGG